MTLGPNDTYLNGRDMKPKNNMVTVKTEPSADNFLKAKMAIANRTNQKRNIVPSLENVRSTVLVNNSVPQRTVISNGRSPVVSSPRPVQQQRNVNQDLMRCKRKINFVPGQNYPGTQPASVARRNARERNRVKQVNNGFATLRSHIPPSVAAALTSEKPNSRNTTANKKLSKVETLKMAVEYIRSLQRMLEEHNNVEVKPDPENRYANENRLNDHYIESEDRYYSSSPDSSSQTVISSNASEMILPHDYYSNSPERIFPKSEPTDEFYISRRGYTKSEPTEELYGKSDYNRKFDSFNNEIHDTLTSEFYNTRSPVKGFYPSPQRSPENRQSPDFRQFNSSPVGGTITVLNSVPSNQVAQFTGHSFIQPRIHQRNSTSLSPPISEVCPSPTPSYSSDNSSIHPSSTSLHITSALSRLSASGSLHNQLIVQDPLYASSPVIKQTSSSLITNSPPPMRHINPSPNSVISSSVTASGSSGSPTFQNGLEYQKESPNGYDYEPMSPEDEELLDVISWWQQSN